jgi:hypothetical protein
MMAMPLQSLKTKAQTSSILGISEESLMRLIARRELLPSYKWKGELYFKPKNIERYILRDQERLLDNR